MVNIHNTLLKRVWSPKLRTLTVSAKDYKRSDACFNNILLKRKMMAEGIYLVSQISYTLLFYNPSKTMPYQRILETLFADLTNAVCCNFPYEALMNTVPSYENCRLAKTHFLQFSDLPQHNWEPVSYNFKGTIVYQPNWWVVQTYPRICLACRMTSPNVSTDMFGLLVQPVQTYLGGYFWTRQIIWQNLWIYESNQFMIWKIWNP